MLHRTHLSSWILLRPVIEILSNSYGATHKKIPTERHQHVTRVTRVADFLAKHTSTAANIDSEEACPVCLEEYEPRRRAPLQIKEAEGCKHIFCKTCLKKILCKHPSEGKRCTCCRTAWITVADSPASRPSIPQAEHEAEMAGMRSYVSVLESVVEVFQEGIASYERGAEIAKTYIESLKAGNKLREDACESAEQLNRMTVALLIKELADPEQDAGRCERRIEELRALSVWCEAEIQEMKDALECEKEARETLEADNTELQRTQADTQTEDRASDALSSQR